jgi:hypothetical protein
MRLEMTTPDGTFVTLRGRRKTVLGSAAWIHDNLTPQDEGEQEEHHYSSTDSTSERSGDRRYESESDYGQDVPVVNARLATGFVQ